MQDVEIESLLEDAGYAYNTTTGRYDVIDANADENAEAYDQGSEEVADILEIPLDDLQRWEAEQREADDSAGAGGD